MADKMQANEDDDCGRRECERRAAERAIAHADRRSGRDRRSGQDRRIEPR